MWLAVLSKRQNCLKFFSQLIRHIKKALLIVPKQARKSELKNTQEKIFCMLRLSVNFFCYYIFREENLLTDFLPENTQKITHKVFK